ncbi:hypothetical protein EOM09_04150 [bacterium]|nr:hypothetical protein [bacterium]
MILLNLKSPSGIYRTIKLIDAFKIQNENLSVVLLYNDEKENDLLKIYIAKYENGKLLSVTEEEWSKIKVAMSNIISNKEKYELISVPNMLSLEGQLKPCLIKTFMHFENHYGNKNVFVEQPKVQSPIENTKIFSNNTVEEKEPAKEGSISFIAQKAKQELEAEKQTEESVIEGNDYKEQKENLIKVISRSVDEILELKNKEIVELNDKIETLEENFRKSELEKKQALNVINLYHEKIKKLNELLKIQREG